MSVSPIVRDAMRRAGEESFEAPAYECVGPSDYSVKNEARSLATKLYDIKDDLGALSDNEDDPKIEKALDKAAQLVDGAASILRALAK